MNIFGSVHLIGDGGHAKVIKDILRLICEPGSRFSEFWIVAIGDNKTRKRVVAENSHCQFCVAVHPSAVIAQNVVIGDGTVVMAGAVIQPNTVIGKHCIINTSATVDHDCVIEDFAHIAPGAHLCGGVEVGEGALVGVGSCAVPKAKIAPWSLVKAGTVAK